ncbi:hypothetical protein OU798_10220 [Prolixibacteraceae bacterium Z1-6]|uniref:Outer membrane protein beta-barrel domain-containing protein n=1 Tax=Draconibacterium aestuarii TaxID=2998507 RepID=A0A9X3J7H9_9BACT|nr:hypothetical protein [Prolixibacteraceae bacterium Z1-6]
MITLSPTRFHKKFLPFACALFFVLCTSENTKAQTIIFKKDGSQIVAGQIIISSDIISFQIDSDTTARKKFIGISAVDSIRYADGTMKYFKSEPLQTVKKEENYEYNPKNFAGINMWPLFYSRINVYYERLFWGNKMGFRNYFMFDVGSTPPSYYTINRSAQFYYSAGINFYFHQSYFSRLGVGVSYLTGNFESDYWYHYDPYSDSQNYQTSGIILNTSYSYKVYNQLHAAMVVQVPIGFKEFEDPLNVQLEISFHF